MKELIQLFKKIYHQISPVYRTVRRMEDKVDNLTQKLGTLASRQEAIFWWQMNQSGEMMSETKKRVFQSMPKAEGTLRTIQLGSDYLLKQLKKICEENGISYWISFGTLLGAARHGGFIPWDDDIDVSLLRNDFEKLRKVLEQNKTFALRPYYDEDGPFYLYKMVFQESNSIFWVDITVWDYADTKLLGEQETWRHITKVREQTMSEISQTARHFAKRYHSEALSHADATTLQEVFKKNILLLPPVHTPDRIYRSLDSVYLGGETLMKLDEIFPLCQLSFEGMLYPAPAKYEQYLTLVYHYLDLPLKIMPTHLNISADMAEQVEECFQTLGLEQVFQHMNDRK